MGCTDIIAAEIHNAGWSYGTTAYYDASRKKTSHVADAHKPDRMRCVVRAETLKTALMELRAMTVAQDREHCS